MKINFKDKNLLVIAHSYSNFVKDQVDALSKYFNHIYVLVRHNPIANVSEYIPINYLKPFKLSSIIDLNNKPDNITVIATSIIYLPTSSQYRKLGDKHFRVVDRVIKEKHISFDMVHAHFTWTAGYVGAKLKDKYGVPFILTIHENRDWFLKQYKSGDKNIYYTWENADKIIRVNSVDVPLLKKINKNVVNIPNGYNDKIFFKMNCMEARQALNLPQEKKIILSIGQLVKRKGFEYLIDAISFVAEKEKDILCIICGHGGLKNSLEKRIKKLKLQDKIKLVGFVSHNKLFLWINSCDIFVLPSLSESFGLVQLEAMACGKPVVATYNGGSEEIITTEEYGLLCDPVKPKELAKKILIALKKDWETEKIIKYSEQFNWENVVKNILNNYTN